MSAAGNIEKFLSGVVRSKSAPIAFGEGRARRVGFSHRGRSYAAVRYLSGRVELYSVEKDGWTETFLRYAAPKHGALDVAAIEASGDSLDQAAKMARDLLLGLYPTARNVRMGPSAGEWGTVMADYAHPQTGRESVLNATIRLWCPLPRPT
jgi:hypothetical protein